MSSYVFDGAIIHLSGGDNWKCYKGSIVQSNPLMCHNLVDVHRCILQRNYVCVAMNENSGSEAGAQTFYLFKSSGWRLHFRKCMITSYEAVPEIQYACNYRVCTAVHVCTSASLLASSMIDLSTLLLLVSLSSALLFMHQQLSDKFVFVEQVEHTGTLPTLAPVQC